MVFPDDTERTAASQRRAERIYLLRYGTFVGILAGLKAADLLSSTGYETFLAQAKATLAPTVVGRV